MYTKIFQDEKPIAMTSRVKYPCPSLPVPSPPFQTYREEPVINTKEYYDNFPSYRSQDVPFSRPPPPLRKPTTPKTMMTELPPSPKERSLLPVLDCRFNLREVCKQSILLEDHLSHEKKRCTDCCIKHFLALEGLCEEAVTLDQKGVFHEKIQNLAQKIRDLQEKWYEDPDNNSHWVSQELRKIRKDFQIDVFPIIFENESLQNEVASCTSGACRIKK